MLQYSFGRGVFFFFIEALNYHLIALPDLLYILTSLWVLHSPNPGWNMPFSMFFVQKAEKGRKRKKTAAKFSAKSNSDWFHLCYKNTLQWGSKEEITVARHPEMTSHIFHHFLYPTLPWTSYLTRPQQHLLFWNIYIFLFIYVIVYSSRPIIGLGTTV